MSVWGLVELAAEYHRAKRSVEESVLAAGPVPGGAGILHIFLTHPGGSQPVQAAEDSGSR